MLILNKKFYLYLRFSSLFPFKWLRMAGFAVPFALGGPVAGLAQDATEEMEPGLFKFTTGFDYTSGDYGDVQDTDIWYVPFAFQYEWAQRVIARLTVPYIRITGPGGVVGGGDDVTVITTTQAAQRQTESGLGDVVGGFAYVIDPFAPAAPYFEVTGKVKFPTADEDDGLGTGEFDYTIQLDSYKSFGPITPAVTAGRKFKGSPEGFELNDVWFTSVGGIYKFNDVYSGGVFYDGCSFAFFTVMLNKQRDTSFLCLERSHYYYDDGIVIDSHKRYISSHDVRRRLYRPSRRPILYPVPVARVLSR